MAGNTWLDGVGKWFADWEREAKSLVRHYTAPPAQHGIS